MIIYSIQIVYSIPLNEYFFYIDVELKIWKRNKNGPTRGRRGAINHATKNRLFTLKQPQGQQQEFSS